jgi:hypothetical protein
MPSISGFHNVSQFLDENTRLQWEEGGYTAHPSGGISLGLDVGLTPPIQNLFETLFTAAEGLGSYFRPNPHSVEGSILNPLTNYTLKLDCSSYISRVPLYEYLGCHAEFRDCNDVDKCSTQQYLYPRLEYEIQKDQQDSFLWNEVIFDKNRNIIASNQFDKYLETPKLFPKFVGLISSSDTSELNEKISSLSDASLFNWTMTALATAGAAYVAYKIGSYVSQFWTKPDEHRQELDQLITLAKQLESSDDEELRKELHSRLEALVEKTADVVTTQKNLMFNGQLLGLAMWANEYDRVVEIFKRLPNLPKSESFLEPLTTCCNTYCNRLDQDRAKALQSLLKEYTASFKQSS